MKSNSFQPLLALSMILFALAGMAQEGLRDPVAQVPLDPKVIYGKLDNGLTYYIRENKNPVERAELYLVVNTGAVQEEDDQDGLAHFCEHMAFNGTKNFEKKEILNYLQSIGMKFGPEINAFTSTDETNYMLQRVPTGDQKLVDTALMVLYEWACNVAFEEVEIDNERGVIHEEWRTGRDAMSRMMREAMKTIYYGSKYAERDVIGDVALIDTFPYDALRRFYRKWYRPDLQAIVAVGDFDVRVMEKKIRDMFSQIPARPDKIDKPSFPLPDHAETLVTIHKDKESPYSMVQLFYKHPPEEYKNMQYYRNSVVEQIFNGMMNNRLQELLQLPEPPFIYAYTGYSDLTRTKDAYISFALAKNSEMDKSLTALLTENERLKKYGFTQGELDRQKADLLTQTEKQYNERDKQKNDAYVWQYFSHFLTGEPTPGIEFDYQFIREILPGITLEELNSLAKSWITEQNRVIALMAPEKEDIVIPTEQDVRDILATTAKANVEPYVDKVSDKPLIEEEPTTGKLAKKSKDKKLGTTTWTFENGVKVVLKPTDFKEDEIRMTAFSYGGSSLYEIPDLVSASFAVPVVMESGIADFDKIELDKKMAGKIVNVSPQISDNSEGFSGSCTPKDLETMLQMVHLYFTRPRFDETAFNAYIGRMKAALANRANDPSSALWDSVTVIMANHHPRVRPMKSELLDEANLNRIRSIFKERFGDPSSFTFYFVGNIDPEKAQPLIGKYLGGLPKVTRQENWRDNGIRPPAGLVEEQIKREMADPKGTVYINITGTYDFDDYQERMNLSALCDVLDVRYVETVREEQGGTYGVAVYEQHSKYPFENYRVNIYFDCDPENVTKLKGIIYNEIEKLKKEGPTEKDLKGVVENYLKTYQENQRENGYWLNVLKDHEYHALDFADVLEYPDYVANLTIESLKAAANRLFGGNVAEIILVPESLDHNVRNPMIRQE